MSIPRRIIQTARSSNLPPLARAAATNLRLLHPDWSFEFFDDAAVADFMAREDAKYQAVFAGFPRKIQRFDFFRYLAVYRLGGFYFDLDVFLSKSLDPLSSHDCVFPFEELTLSRYLRQACRMDWEIGNYGFGAAPGHPFLKAVIDNCVRAQDDPSWVAPMLQGIPAMLQTDFRVLASTGPGLVSRTLVENPDLSPQVTVLFPDDVCDEDQWHLFGDYGVHLMEGSWRDQGGFLRRRLANYWEAWTKRRYLPQSRSHGKTRSASGLRQNLSGTSVKPEVAPAISEA
jgi:hypothetical protein